MSGFEGGARRDEVPLQNCGNLIGGEARRSAITQP
jgi:hypothetical protein